ncbi:MAG TPA: hypothetical protein VMI53_12835 [Opitutaceae bacterium]|nr:hypothetical protein [Opitutaceae bacterium]
MNPPETNDPLDALLRAQDTHVEDGGFTTRVLAALPRRRPWLRPTLLLGATVIVAMLAAWWLPWENLFPLGSPALLLLSPKALLPWLLLIAAVSSLVTGAMAVFRWED